MKAQRFILQKVPHGDVRRSRDIGRVVQELESLPEGKTWLVTTGPYRKDRSLEQNAALHGLAYEVLTKHTGYTKPELHDIFLCSYFGEVKYQDLSGKTKARPRRTTTTNERGDRDVISTADFMQFYSHIQQLAAEHWGCDVPDPDPLWFTKEQAA